MSLKNNKQKPTANFILIDKNHWEKLEGSFYYLETEQTHALLINNSTYVYHY